MYTDMIVLNKLLDKDTTSVRLEIRNLIIELQKGLNTISNGNLDLVMSGSLFSKYMLDRIDKKVIMEYDNAALPKDADIDDTYKKIYFLYAYNRFLGNLQETIQSNSKLKELMDDFLYAQKFDKRIDPNKFKSYCNQLAMTQLWSIEL